MVILEGESELIDCVRVCEAVYNQCIEKYGDSIIIDRVYSVDGLYMIVVCNAYNNEIMAVYRAMKNVFSLSEVDRDELNRVLCEASEKEIVPVDSKFRRNRDEKLQSMQELIYNYMRYKGRYKGDGMSEMSSEDIEEMAETAIEVYGELAEVEKDADVCKLYEMSCYVAVEKYDMEKSGEVDKKQMDNFVKGFANKSTIYKRIAAKDMFYRTEKYVQLRQIADILTSILIIDTKDREAAILRLHEVRGEFRSKYNELCKEMLRINNPVVDKVRIIDEAKVLDMKLNRDINIACEDEAICC